jgi:hypothetical protein
MESTREMAKDSEAKSSESTRTRQPLCASVATLPLLLLQKEAGNQAVQHLLRSRMVQAKLANSGPGAPEEREADQVAGHVMRAYPGYPINLPCSCAESEKSCESCRRANTAVQRHGNGEAESNTLAAVGAGSHAMLYRLSRYPHDGLNRAFLGSHLGQDFGRLLPLRWHLDLPGTVETAGEAHCDLDLGRMTWSVDPAKLPLCMADCAKEHELAHVAFGNESCAKVVAAYKAVEDALNKAKTSKSETDFKDAERKKDDFKTAVDKYTKWFHDTCRENEHRAYQVGIDACKKDEVKKSCADFRQTDEYNRIMRDWERFRDNPPNCEPVPEPKK